MTKENLSPSKLKVVIFDFDDTIYNTNTWACWPPYVEKMLVSILGTKKKVAAFLKKYGIDYSTSGQQIAIALISEIGTAKDMTDYLEKNILDIWSGARIVSLSNADFEPIRKKYKLYVLSNGARSYVLAHFLKMGIDKDIFEEVYQNDFEKFNPTKQVVYKKIIDQERVKPEEVVMIGDNYANDIVPAVELGMQGAWVNDLADVRSIIKRLSEK